MSGRFGFVGRDSEIALLSNVAAPAALQGRPIFVFGSSATGKTTVVRAVIDSLTEGERGARSAYVNATEVSFSTPKRLFEIILNKLAGHIPSASNGYSCRQSCDTAAEFCNGIIALGGDAAASMYVIIDKVERLRNIDGAINTLIRLPELTGRKICVVLISAVVWDRLQGFSSIPDPIQMHFANYSQKTFFAILMHKQSACGADREQRTLQLWGPFIFMLTEMYSSVCRDLNELQHLATELFPVFCKPVLDGTVSPEDHTRLYKLCRPVFKEGFEKLYLHEAPGEQATEGGPTTQSSSSLPHHAKYMLIAGFLASYLPPRLDLKNFTQLERRRLTNNMLTGADAANVEPKMFTLDRLLAVFYAVLQNERVETSVAPDVHLLISSLVSLALFTKMSSDLSLNSIKYKCIAEPKMVHTVAESLNMDLRGFF